MDWTFWTGRSSTAWPRRLVLRALGAAAALPALGGIATADGTHVVVDFDGVGPENLAVDADGAAYMTMNFSGAVRKLDADDAKETDLGIGDTSLVTTLDPGPNGFVTGIVERDGTLYVALPSFDSGADDHGIWEVTQAEGGASKRLLAPLPLDALPNGVLLDPAASRLLVTDSFRGQVLGVDLDDGAVTTWLDDPLLDPDTFIGANGLAMDPAGDLFVANLDHGRIVRVPVADDGAAGQPEVLVEDAALVGADGLTVHEGRMLYVAVNGRDRVVRVTPSGRIVTVVDADDGLDFPADVAFGTGPTSGRLFVANFAFDTASGTISGDPSLVRTHP